MDFSLAGRFTTFEIRAFVVTAIVIAAAWFWPRAGSGLFSRIERAGSRLSLRKTACWMGMGVLLIAMRLALWPIEKAPVPRIQDEFSYLLAADTFVHGRLTNPTPPYWVFFETVFVNMRPTYMSKYMPGQGAALAAGQLLGHPWIGVLLSVAAMCAAITWMLQGWLPPRWALLGGLLVVSRFFFGFGYDMNYWLESYWGGAVAATGGALALGALPRILRRGGWRQGAVLGLGVAILVFSRPYEGAVLCVPLAAALGWRVLREREGLRRMAPAMAAAGCVLGAAGAFLAYYNWRGTGDPFLLPYVLNDRTYLSTPNFVWQSMGPPLTYRTPQFDAVFNTWCRMLWSRDRLALSWNGIRWGLLRKLDLIQTFYFPASLGLMVLVTFWRLLKNRKARFLIAVWLSIAAGVALTVWFQRHYPAPATAAAFGLMVFAIRSLRQWKPGGRPVGLGMSRALVGLYFAFIPVNMSLSWHDHTIANECWWACTRAGFEEQLRAMPGKHLIVVRYTTQHHPGKEWVFNGADMEGAKVLWAREVPGADMAGFLACFKDRRLWLVEPDKEPPTLEELKGDARQTLIDAAVAPPPR